MIEYWVMENLIIGNKAYTLASRMRLGLFIDSAGSVASVYKLKDVFCGTNFGNIT